jgi:hypothetical protein
MTTFTTPDDACPACKYKLDRVLKATSRFQAFQPLDRRCYAGVIYTRQHTGFYPSRERLAIWECGNVATSVAVSPLGATGRFPEGHHPGRDDEGELAVAIAADKKANRVLLDLAEMLRHKARQLKS